MASRHLSRSAVLQALFECDIKDALTLELAHEALNRNLSENPAGEADQAFAESLLSGILEKREEIDQIIVKAAPQWPLEKIAPIDRNVLRLGLYELLFADRSEVPPKVALNEAIEIAKSYGGDSSSKFINGVLGAVYRSIGSPGKGDAPKGATPLPHEHLGGIFLTSKVSGTIYVALVHDAFGKSTLPKAHCKEGELSRAAALRAMEDELGVSGSLRGPLGEHEYVAHDPATGRIVRTVGYFLAFLDTQQALKCKVCEGITETRWFSEEELFSLDLYSDLVPIFEAGIKAAKHSP